MLAQAFLASILRGSAVAGACVTGDRCVPPRRGVSVGFSVLGAVSCAA